MYDSFISHNLFLLIINYCLILFWFFLNNLVLFAIAFLTLISCDEIIKIDMCKRNFEILFIKLNNKTNYTN